MYLKNHLILNPLILCLAMIILCSIGCSNGNEGRSEGNQMPDTVRFASYNVSMFRDGEQALRLELGDTISDQVSRVTAVIQHVRPDVIALMEFDYDETGESLVLFSKRCLEVSQHGQQPITYQYNYQVPSNTGLPSGVDLNGDSIIQLPEDAHGFGRHHGQYAFALLSRYPIENDQIRSFQKFLWKDMPDPLWPVREDSTSWYSEEAKSVLRLSSKNHIALPLSIGSKVVHVVLAHPTPPVFDGPEDRNGRRNFDEIRLLHDYIDNANYLMDDNGLPGGLADSESFVVMGDLNADPVQGDAVGGAIEQLFDSDRINPAVTYGRMIPASEGALGARQRDGFDGEKRHNTSMFGMRIDYVLPSSDLEVISSGVFWPPASDSLKHALIKDGAASDHMLVWVDVTIQ